MEDLNVKEKEEAGLKIEKKWLEVFLASEKKGREKIEQLSVWEEGEERGARGSQVFGILIKEELKGGKETGIETEPRESYVKTRELLADFTNLKVGGLLPDPPNVKTGEVLPDPP